VNCVATCAIQVEKSFILKRAARELPEGCYITPEPDSTSGSELFLRERCEMKCSEELLSLCTLAAGRTLGLGLNYIGVLSIEVVIVVTGPCRLLFLPIIGEGSRKLLELSSLLHPRLSTVP